MEQCVIIDGVAAIAVNILRVRTPIISFTFASAGVNSAGPQRAPFPVILVNRDVMRGMHTAVCPALKKPAPKPAETYPL